MRISDPPTHGIHSWLMTAARQCQLQGIGPGEAVAILDAFEGRLRRKYQPNEVRNAVEKVFATSLPERPDDRARTAQAGTTKPTPERRSEWQPIRTNVLAISDRIARIDLWEASPIKIDGGFTQSFCLEGLFPDPEGLVCIGKSMAEFHTARLRDFRDLSKASLIVAAYMTTKYGKTQAGKPSMHTLDNTGPRRFCVCDFDEPSSDHHASIIWHMRKLFRLVLVLSSGGKSLHAWFNVPEHEEDDFWRLAVSLGADPAIQRNRSQFVRLPCGTRDNGNRQGVFYFDLEAAAK